MISSHGPIPALALQWACPVQGEGTQGGACRAHHLVWKSLSCEWCSLQSSPFPQNLSTNPRHKNEQHEENLLQNTDFPICLLWHIYQPSIFRNIAILKSRLGTLIYYV